VGVSSGESGISAIVAADFARRVMAMKTQLHDQRAPPGLTSIEVSFSPTTLFTRTQTRAPVAPAGKHAYIEQFNDRRGMQGSTAPGHHHHHSNTGRRSEWRMLVSPLHRIQWESDQARAREGGWASMHTPQTDPVINIVFPRQAEAWVLDLTAQPYCLWQFSPTCGNGSSATRSSG
jgi:hypothetical protein